MPVVFINWKYIVVFGLTELRINLHFSGKLHEIYAVISFPWAGFNSYVMFVYLENCNSEVEALTVQLSP